MQYLPIILTVAAIHLLAVMSPGPDFIMILRNSLLYTRKNGIYSAAGLGLGISLHVTYCLLGIALIISQSILLFSIIKYAGAAYLIWIGIKSLRAGPEKELRIERDDRKELTNLQALRIGFITNATNPKATLFFLSLFTLVIKSTTPLWVKTVMGIEMVTATFLWFSLVSIIASHRVVRKRVIKFQYYAERFMGGILILFGLKLASERLK